MKHMSERDIIIYINLIKKDYEKFKCKECVSSYAICSFIS